jgi:hypothetical protein
MLIAHMSNPIDLMATASLATPVHPYPTALEYIFVLRCRAQSLVRYS